MRVDLPIEVFLGLSIVTIFMRFMVWECHGIHGVGFAYLVNKSSSCSGQHGHLGLRNINGNGVHGTLDGSSWYLHLSTGGSENTFDGGILRNGCACTSQGGVSLKFIRVSRDREGNITKNLLGIIFLLWIGPCLGCRGLQEFKLTIILPPVISLIWVIHIGGSVYLLLPLRTLKCLRHFSKIYLFRNERFKWIKLSIQCEGPVIIRIKSCHLLCGSWSSRSCSSTALSASCVFLVRRGPCLLGAWLGLGIGLDGNGYFGVFKDGIHYLLRYK